MAVRKAIKAGRLQKSLGTTESGRPVVIDFELAKVEWTATSRTAHGVRTVGSQVSEGPRGPADVIEAATLVEAQRLATIQRERKLRLENDVSEGRLLSVELVKKEAFEAERTIRENVLNIPARIAGELAAESDAGRVHLKLDAALRDALNVVADILLAAANG